MDETSEQSGALPAAAIYPFEEAAAPRTLSDILNATISEYPDAPAIDNGTSCLTYGELAKEVASRATQLHAAGFGAGDRIGVRIRSGTLELYIAILAILDVGAAYVPVDVEDPEQRAQLIWAEADVGAVLDDKGMTWPNEHSSRRDGTGRQPRLDDEAWIIFTSGSTGKPKGVAVTHRSAAAFVDAEAQIFLPHKPLAPGDRVLAGLSVAFDASCEEMWLAWRHGACLVPAPRSLVKAGADLGLFLVQQRITVVSTVPTLAALWPVESLRTLRLLILGGEACPPELSDRLTRNVESVWNTYGPTEATVVSCAAELRVASPVSIGLPLRGWKLAVIGVDGNPVRWGEEGELLIGGAGMARYLDLDRDAAKFAPSAVFGGQRAYRTGDLVRAEPNGLVFIGRNDEQIKLGGRRIELGEIDAALMALPGVSASASTIQRTEAGNQVLVGYVVRNHAPDAAERDILRRLLPAGLAPVLVTVEDIPVRTSGKVDRKALPWPPPTQLTLPNLEDEPPGAALSWVSDKWREILGVSPNPDSDFFDLGGTSLGAAQLVSQLRQQCPVLSVADVYEYRCLKTMVARIEELKGPQNEDRKVDITTRWAGMFQCLVVAALLLLEGCRWLAALAVSRKLFELRIGGNTWPTEYAMPWWAAVLAFVILYPVAGRLVTTVAVARLLTLGILPGTYRRASIAHLRLWAAERFVAIGRLEAIAGTQWCRYYALLLGCHVGADVQLHALPPVTGLAHFGDGCAVESEADIAGWWLDGDTLHIGAITIGDGARVGGRATLMPGVVVEPYAEVPPGTSVAGIISAADSNCPSFSDKTRSSETKSINQQPFLVGLRYTLTLFSLDILPLLLVAPTWGLTPIVVSDYSDFRSMCIGMMQMMVPGAIIGIFLYAAAVVGLTRLAGLCIRPGSHSWHSSAAWGACLTHFLMVEARNTLFPLFASLLTPTWLRLLGARIGRKVESSTVVSIPSLLRVDDGAFLADDVLLCPFELNHGRIHLGISSVGAKTFIGNSAIVSSDVSIPASALIGVLGSAPELGTNHMEAGTSWLGRPAISLPRRIEAQVDKSLTFEPPMRLVIGRAVVESFRIVPLILFSSFTTLIGIGLLWTWNKFGAWVILASGAFLLVGGIAACSIATLARWLLTPTICAGSNHALWSFFVWRNELADSFVQALAVPYMVRFVYGTPLLCIWMCTLGAKIGRGVWLESHLLPEADLCILEDGATINRGCILQTHLFHDRLMRLDKVHLGPGATVGPLAVTLPGTFIGPGATVYPTSLVMRGEHIPGGSRWKGNPVRPFVTEDNIIKGGSERSA